MKRPRSQPKASPQGMFALACMAGFTQMDGSANHVVPALVPSCGEMMAARMNEKGYFNKFSNVCSCVASGHNSRLSGSRKTGIIADMKELDQHEIRPCLACGRTDAHMESMLPPGRRQEVWRVVCSCGQTLQQWSVSQGAAIRAWNRNLAQEKEPYVPPPVTSHEK